MAGRKKIQVFLFFANSEIVKFFKSKMAYLDENIVPTNDSFYATKAYAKDMVSVLKCLLGKDASFFFSYMKNFNIFRKQEIVP